MTTPVPYTRTAVQMIRNGVSAAQLGWPESMFASICNRHGIACEKAPAEAIARTQKSARELDFRHRSGEVIRAGIVVSLPDMQAKVFKPLYERFIVHDESFVPGDDLAQFMSEASVRRSAGRAVHRLNVRLAPLRCWIEAKGGRDGGFRLRMDT